MNNFERVRDMVDEYVRLNGTNTEMDRNEFIGWVHKKYENISVEKNNLYPTDISYNLYNAGLKDFPGPNLCLLYVEERDVFRLVGTGYKHTGPIWQYKGKSNEKVVGMWSDGECHMGDSVIDDYQLPKEILNRRDDLFDGVKASLQAIPVMVGTEKNTVFVKFQELLICGISVEEEGYKIFNASSEWADTTSYQCWEAENATWYYFLETIDECIGETQRLAKYESQKANKNTDDRANSKDCRERAEYIVDAIREEYFQFANIESKYNEKANEVAISISYKSGANRIDNSRILCTIWIHSKFVTDDIKVRDAIYEAMERAEDIQKDKFDHIVNGLQSKSEKGFAYLCLKPYDTNGVIDTLIKVSKAYWSIN